MKPIDKNTNLKKKFNQRINGEKARVKFFAKNCILPRGGE